MPPKNNTTRLLDSRKIPYVVFETAAEKLSALDVAQLLKIPPEVVYKTIVVTREGAGPRARKPILAVVPAPCTVDLKTLAAVLGEKKLHLPTEREAEKLTGLQAGGISPLALIHRGFQVILDQSAQTLDELHISGGQRGLNIRLRVMDFLRLTKARLAPICLIEA